VESTRELLWELHSRSERLLENLSLGTPLAEGDHQKHSGNSLSQAETYRKNILWELGLKRGDYLRNKAF